MKDLLIFDMDGVLVDVTESYRATIQATVRHFTGNEPSREEIQDWKNRGGWNDDWLLSHNMIQNGGGSAGYREVVDYFQKIFHGSADDPVAGGLIQRERWLASNGLFQRLAQKHHLTVFTGRLRWEAHVTLDRFEPNLFTHVVGADDVSRTKPDPEGILKIRAALEHGACWYVGDTVDDARAASAAGVPFIGIAALANPRYAELVRLLRSEGAVAILDDINGMEAILAAKR